MYMVLYIQPDLCSKVDLCYPAGATFGNPHGNPCNKVVLSLVKPSQLLDVERKNDTAEKLARSLLLLLFTHSELASGNCTRPVHEDIKQLDSERLWAIKCNPPPKTVHVVLAISLAVCLGHIDYLYPASNLEGEDQEKAGNRRWSQIMQKTLNPVCRHLRTKGK